MSERENATIRLDRTVVDQARRAAGLPDGTNMAQVVRFALARLAGLDPTPHLDSTVGRGSLTHQTRRNRVAA